MNMMHFFHWSILGFNSSRWIFFTLKISVLLKNELDALQVSVDCYKIILNHHPEYTFFKKKTNIFTQDNCLINPECHVQYSQEYKLNATAYICTIFSHWDFFRPGLYSLSTWTIIQCCIFGQNCRHVDRLWRWPLPWH